MKSIVDICADNWKHVTPEEIFALIEKGKIKIKDGMIDESTLESVLKITVPAERVPENPVDTLRNQFTGAWRQRNYQAMLEYGDSLLKALGNKVSLERSTILTKLGRASFELYNQWKEPRLAEDSAKKYNGAVEMAEQALTVGLGPATASIVFNGITALSHLANMAENKRDYKSMLELVEKEQGWIRDLRNGELASANVLYEREAYCFKQKALAKAAMLGLPNLNVQQIPQAQKPRFASEVRDLRAATRAAYDHFKELRSSAAGADRDKYDKELIFTTRRLVDAEKLVKNFEGKRSYNEDFPELFHTMASCAYDLLTRGQHMDANRRTLISILPILCSSAKGERQQVYQSLLHHLRQN